MRQFLNRTWRYLDREPGPLPSFIVLIAAALALGALLNGWSAPY